MIFEMFPFIFLLTTQFFFIKLFNNNELEVFKYSGLKNSNILWILSLLSFSISVIIIIVFYNFSANLKNFYLEKKSQYTSDGKYLAVITKNGLWIKDEIDNKIYIINSSEIKDNFLIKIRLNFPKLSINVIEKKLDKGKYFYLKKRLDQNDKEKLWSLGEKGIIFEPFQSRINIHSSLYSNLLGKVDYDNYGITGVENYLDN